MARRNSGKLRKQGRTFYDILKDAAGSSVLDDAAGSSVRMHAWEPWAGIHLLSAAALARMAGEIEVAYGPSDGEQVIKHRACVTGSVLLSVVFMESAINELFAEAHARNPLGTITQVDPQVARSLAEQTFGRNVGFLSKYQAALRIAGKQKFKQNAQPYRDAEALRDLRNELQHYSPEWKYAGVLVPGLETPQYGPPHTLAGKFPPNRMVPSNMSETLHKYLGHSCAKWAVESSLAFVDSFYLLLDITAPYESWRPLVNTG